MDATDVKLMKILSQNSHCTASEISSKVNLSIPAVNKRISRLKASGAIKSFSIQADAKVIGKPIVAFIMVVLERYSKIEELMAYVDTDDDIVECHAITGEYDYLLKVYAKDINDLESKLIKLKSGKGISKSHTMFSLLEHKHLPGPLPEETNHDEGCNAK